MAGANRSGAATGTASTTCGTTSTACGTTSTACSTTGTACATGTAHAASAAHAASTAAARLERAEGVLRVDAEGAVFGIRAGRAHTAIGLAVGARFFADAIADGSTHEDSTAPKLGRAAFIVGLAATTTEADIASAYADVARGAFVDDRQIEAKPIVDAAAITVIDVATERANAGAESFAIARANAETIAAFVLRCLGVAAHAELLAHGGIGIVQTDSNREVAVTARRTFGVIATGGQTEITRGYAVTGNVFTAVAFVFVERIVQVLKLGTKLASQNATAFLLGIRLEADVGNTGTIAAGLTGHRAVTIGWATLEDGVGAFRLGADTLGARLLTLGIRGACQTEPFACGLAARG